MDTFLFEMSMKWIFTFKNFRNVYWHGKRHSAVCDRKYPDVCNMHAAIIFSGVWTKSNGIFYPWAKFPVALKNLSASQLGCEILGDNIEQEENAVQQKPSLFVSAALNSDIGVYEPTCIEIYQRIILPSITSINFMESVLLKNMKYPPQPRKWFSILAGIANNLAGIDW